MLKPNEPASSLILSTLVMAAKRSSETFVFTIATWRHIPEDDILQILEHIVPGNTET
jgi:hypothetical protein